MKNTYIVLGLMSGTSLDGVDLALCDFELTSNRKWAFKCLKALTYSYPPALIDTLKRATALSGEELKLLDIELGRWFGEKISEFLSDIDKKPDFIASHGHTIFHQPNKQMTLQIGSGWTMLQKAGIPVINDFRSKDMALCGQGAPLVPIGDQLLFPEYDYCINLGGIANISCEMGGKRIAYDITACNMVLNYLSQKLGSPFDKDGMLARQGKVIDTLLDQLDQWPYYARPYPKSLGYEQIEAELIPMIENDKYQIADLLATYVKHLAQRIAFCIDNGTSSVLVTGGGTYNQFLVEKIKTFLPTGAKLIVPEPELIEYKEAIIFAFLGVLRIRNEVNCLASVTGATSDSCGGVVYQ